MERSIKYLNKKEKITKFFQNLKTILIKELILLKIRKRILNLKMLKNILKFGLILNSKVVNIKKKFIKKLSVLINNYFYNN